MKLAVVHILLSGFCLGIGVYLLTKNNWVALTIGASLSYSISAICLMMRWLAGQKI